MAKKLLRILIAFSAAFSLAAVILCFLLPYMNAVIPAFSGSGELTLGAYRILRIFGYTFLESFCSMLVALVVGLLGAWLLSCTGIWGKRFLVSLGSVPLCIPPLIIALAYISCFGMNGMYNRFLMRVLNLNEVPLRFLYSFLGVVTVQGFYNFPLVMVTVSERWTSMSQAEENAARILGAGKWRVFRTVTLHKLIPSIVSSCIPVFLYCFFSFMIVLLFGSAGGTTLELAVYRAGRSDLNFRNAAVLSLLETLSAFCIILFYSRIEKKSGHDWHRSFIKRSRSAPICSALFYLLIFVFFLFPLISVFISSFSAEVWRRVLGMRGFFPALRNTLITAFFTAALCTLSGFAYALFLKMRPRLGRNVFMRTIPLLPMAVSSVTMGLGFSGMVRRGSPLVLVLAQSALSWPFAFRQIQSQMADIPRQTLDAAMLLSENRADAVFSVVIPYSRKGIISAFCFCFAISAGDATLPLVLSVPRFDTLALFTYRLAGSYRFREGAASALVLGILCMSVFSIAGIVSGAKKGGADVS